MITDEDRLFAIAPAMLGDIGNRRVIECPERIFVESLDPLFQADFDTIGEKIVLPKEVLLLNPVKKRRIVFSPDRHRSYLLITPRSTPEGAKIGAEYGGSPSVRCLS
ncbi:hypothetical protein [Fulvimarina sp. MAC8]|uniref:hypothetical protein n=1 Tax=Fulvimarina sp. MAC8 TaxID=3162874 RepID=UPI0032EC8E83